MKSVVSEHMVELLTQYRNAAATGGGDRLLRARQRLENQIASEIEAARQDGEAFRQRVILGVEDAERRTVLQWLDGEIVLAVQLGDSAYSQWKDEDHDDVAYWRQQEKYFRTIFNLLSDEHKLPLVSPS